MGLGIPGDFINGPLKDLGRTVRIFRVTEVISNIEGDQTIEPGPVREITVVLAPIKNQEDTQGKEGLFAQQTARLYSLPADNVQHDDIIEHEGRFYRLERPVRRYCDEANSTPIYDHTLCHLYEGLPSGPLPGTGRFIGPHRGIPENASKGDWWYDTEDKQYKGYDGTDVVILG